MEEKIEEKKRNSNIEMLRIICIILIIAHHYALYGGWNLVSGNNNNYIIGILTIGGKVGVNCFFIITGYFMINSKIKFKKICEVILKTLFYSVFLFALLRIFGLSNQKITPIEALAIFFPTSYCKWWFVTNYVILYFLIPYLNKFIMSLEKKQCTSFICMVLLFLSVIPTLTGIDNTGIGYILWTFVTYFIGAYIGLYYKDIKVKDALAILIISLSLMVIKIMINCYKLINASNSSICIINNLIDANQILIIAISISLFLFFKNLPIKKSKIVNTIATTTLGIYLIHEDSYFRPYLWEKLLNVNQYYKSMYFIPITIIEITGVFAALCLTDLIVEKIIKKIANKTIFGFKGTDKLFCKIDEKLNLE